ncbi:MAG: hypothetical protein N4A74_21500 [Carboxylicivirga sp.]|jgi:phage terminase large subunit-like protein|nr:hypothetical protein [Carboxylicivirga sp.]
MATKITKKDRDAIAEYAKRVAWILENAEKGSFETKKQRDDAIARAKKDINFMVRRYFSHIADCDSGEFQIELAGMVKRNPTFKGFAEWPRGHAKSVWCTIFIPFWLMINGQSRYFLQISNCFDAAADLLDDLRAELEANDRIIKDFGVQKTAHKKWERGYFITANGFIGRALGIGQKVRGLRVGKWRPDFCEVDDLETEEINGNPQRQDRYASWIEKSLLPTMTGKFRRLLWSNNRWAKRMVQTVLQKKHPNWKVHHVKAYDPLTLEAIAWPEMYPKSYWEGQVRELGTIACQAEYNQKPHTEGKTFTDKLFRWEKVPRIDHYDSIVGYWDVAYSDKETADYNAIKIWGKKGDYYYLVKAFVRQCRMDEAIDWMFLYNSLLPQSVSLTFFYESQFWNDALKMSYKSIWKKWKGKAPEISLVTDERRKGRKYDRILTMLPYYQQGRIIFNAREEGSNDMQEGTAQLKGIEPGYSTHDDSPDADEGAIYKLNELFVPNEPDRETIYGDERRTKRY